MTKSGLIEEVAKRTPHISKKDTEVVVNTIFDSMAQARKWYQSPEYEGPHKLREASARANLVLVDGV